MNKWVLLAAMGPLLFSCTGDGANDTDSMADEASLRATIDIFNAAFERGDVEKLASMITDDYQHTNGNAKSIGRDSWLGYLKKRSQQIEEGTIVVHKYEMDEVEVVQYDGMAIVTARVAVSSSSTGQLSENEYRVTNIWVWESGQWKRAGFHDGKIK